MKKQPSSQLTFIIIVVVLLAVCAGCGYFIFRDTTPPQLTITPDAKFLNKDRTLTISAKDLGTGLNFVQVSVKQGDVDIIVLKKNFTETTSEFSDSLILDKKTVKEGAFTVTVTAKDNSLYPFGSSGYTTITKELTLDTKPPRIAVQTRTHNIRQGGSGLVIYSVDEEPTRTGIEVGDYFFPGYKQPDGTYHCLFAIPFFTSPSQFSPKLIAEDEAGNIRNTGFPYFANPKNYRKDRINIPESFLQSKMPQFEDSFNGDESRIEQFLLVNRNIRKQNRAALQTIGAKTSPTMLWSGKFIQLPNAASRAGFGDQRDYYYKNKKVDHQTHLGQDLASVRHAPIPAANNGVVVYADFFGIYGNCVIVDHGLGLQTLYSHLSQLDVAEGDEVQKGDILGKTGATGMAGGDHLHYGVILSGLPVNPLEWWDARWIKHNITSKLN
ncbi:MAG: M23 family metallopeptidase [Desulfovibrio sp.]